MRKVSWVGSQADLGRVAGNGGGLFVKQVLTGLTAKTIVRAVDTLWDGELSLLKLRMTI